LVTDQVA
jgi:hypothetical protein